MEEKFQFCRLFGMTLIFLGIISNIWMLIHIKTRRTFGRKPRLVIMNLGVINIIFQIYISVYAVYLQSLDLAPVENYFVLFVKSVLNFSHLGANIGIAYDRYLCFTRPWEYRSALGLEQQWRSIWVNGLVCIVLASVTRVLTEVFHFHLAESVALASTRVFTYIVLCYIYFAIHHKIKQTSFIAASKETIHTSAHHFTRREKKVKKLALGVIISFAILSLPIGIFNVFYKMNPDCSTFEGKLAIACLTILAANFSFDPLWYFFTIVRGK